MILIGSSAIKHWFSDFPREPKDLDYITNDEDLLKYPHGYDLKGRKYEYLKNPVFDNYYGKVLYPTSLCTLKASHLCWDINWDKHMFDLQFLLKKGCEIDEELWLELYNYWNEVHIKNKRSDLKMSKDDFFTNAVNYGTNEHDYIHTILNPIPVYTRILKDDCEVELDEEKYKLLSHEDKCNLVREEVMNMAYERYKALNYKVAYTKMLKKFIISHAPIWMVTFILENYIELHKPTINYFKLIENGLQKIK